MYLFLITGLNEALLAALHPGLNTLGEGGVCEGKIGTGQLLLEAVKAFAAGAHITRFIADIRNVKFRKGLH